MMAVKEASLEFDISALYAGTTTYVRPAKPRELQFTTSLTL